MRYEKGGVESVEKGIKRGGRRKKNKRVMRDKGERRNVERGVTKIGDYAADKEVRLDLARSLPSSWSDPVWDQPAGYTLSGGGSVVRPILSIEVGEDLTNAPSRLEIEARASTDKPFCPASKFLR